MNIIIDEGTVRRCPSCGAVVEREPCPSANCPPAWNKGKADPECYWCDGRGWVMQCHECGYDFVSGKGGEVWTRDNPQEYRSVHVDQRGRVFVWRKMDPNTIEGESKGVQE